MPIRLQLRTAFRVLSARCCFKTVFPQRVCGSSLRSLQHVQQQFCAMCFAQVVAFMNNNSVEPRMRARQFLLQSRRFANHRGNFDRAMLHSCCTDVLFTSHARSTCIRFAFYKFRFALHLCSVCVPFVLSRLTLSHVRANHDSILGLCQRWWHDAIFPQHPIWRIGAGCGTAWFLSNWHHGGGEGGCGSDLARIQTIQ